MTISQSITPESTTQNRQYVALAWGRLDDKGLDELLLAASQACEFQYMICQNVASYRFTAYSHNLEPTGYSDGQVFGALGELHWRCDRWVDEQFIEHTGWQAVFVGDVCAAPAIQPHYSPIDLSSKEWQVRSLMIPLRGRRISGQPAWFEPRIPHPLEYPWPGLDEILALGALEFEQAGRVEFVQLCELKAWQSGGSK